MNIKMQIAQTHGVFNISNTLIQLPFVGALASFVTKLIPGEDPRVERGPKYLEPRLLRNPAVALSQAGREVFRMGQLAKRSLEHAIAYFYTEVESEAGKSAELELAINELEREIPNYIVKLMETKLSREDSNLAYTYIQSVNDIERVADHTENVVELTEVRINKGIRFPMRP